MVKLYDNDMLDWRCNRQNDRVLSQVEESREIKHSLSTKDWIHDPAGTETSLGVWSHTTHHHPILLEFYLC